MSNQKRAQVRFVLPIDIRDKFTKLCRKRGYFRSEIIEKLMRIYLKEAEENGVTEYIETRCISCQEIFTQERLKPKKWCSPECFLVYTAFRKELDLKRINKDDDHREK